MKNLDQFRQQRLAQLADKMGGKASLGRRLNYKDGAFIGQMIRGERPITEKTVAAIEELPGCKHWFSGLGDNEAENAASTESADPILHDLVNSFQGKLAVTRLRTVWATAARTGGLIDAEPWDEAEDCPKDVAHRAATLASSDPKCFLVPIGDDSMSPRYNVGEFALVEPGTPLALEDDVLVRFKDGGLALRRLASLQEGFLLAAFNRPGSAHYEPTDLSWIYHVAHCVPSRRVHIKQRQ